MLTRSDDFNALAAAELRGRLGHGHVYRVAPDPEEPDLLPPSPEAGILGSPALTFASSAAASPPARGSSPTIRATWPALMGRARKSRSSPSTATGA